MDLQLEEKQLESEYKQSGKNQDLWIALDQAIQTHNIDWQWVKGHSGHRENEICDELAKQGAETQLSKISVTKASLHLVFKERLFLITN